MSALQTTACCGKVINNRISVIISNADRINNRLINKFYIFNPSTQKVIEWQEVRGVKSQLVCLKPI
jgi:hypothetical protein